MNKLNFANQLHFNQTETEKLLWFHLRGKRFVNIKYKRQQIIGNYIVDFVSFRKKLIIELDGGQHNNPENIIKDITRTEFLKSQGFVVLRYWNNEVFNNIDDIYTKIFPSP